MSITTIQCSKNDTVIAPDNNQPNKKITGLPRTLTTAETHLIASANEFGLNLFKTTVLEKPDKNIFISPLSVSFALGMTYNGSAGTTEPAMRSVLGFGTLSSTEINESYKNLIDMLLNFDPAVQFKIANSVWYRLDFIVEQAFINLAQTFFYASVQGLNFINPSAVTTINDWVSTATNGKITSIIDSIPPEMVMYLINAMYYKGNWTTQFDPRSTADGTFYLSNGSQKVTKMMNLQSEFATGSFPDGTIIDLPYGGEAFSMTIILPKIDTPINAVINTITESTFNSWIQNLSKSKLYLTLPKFKLEFESKLNNVLTDMGMGIAFDDQLANFTNINRNGGLYMSEVKHKTYVDVNEEGTEAAAVTSVGIALTSLPPTFTINRPFIFVIRERFSNTILFMGKIEDPAY